MNDEPPAELEQSVAGAVIERAPRLSDSLLWKVQRQFYVERGVEIWRERPAFAGSASYIAEAVCDSIIALLLDLAPSLDPTSELYIIELGSGSACFSYRLLHHLCRKRKQLNELRHLNVRFILTDIVNDITSVWKQNCQLKPFFDDGTLDCAQFDPAVDRRIHLEHSATTLSSESFVNPPIYLANAVFDTIAVDGFRLLDSSVHQIGASLEGGAQADAVRSLMEQKLLLKQELGDEITFPYYPDDAFDRVLSECIGACSGYDGATIAVPIAALEILRSLQLLCPQYALFMLSRGFTDPLALAAQQEIPYRDLSCPLNFDALRRYFDQNGGLLIAPAGSRTVSYCLALGLMLDSYCKSDHARAWFHENIERKDLINALRQLESTILSGSPEHSRAASAAGSTSAPVSASGAVSASAAGFASAAGSTSAPVSASAAGAAIAAGATPAPATAILIAAMQVLSHEPLSFLTLVSQSLDQIERELPGLSAAQKAALAQVIAHVNENIYTFGRELPAIAGGADLHAGLINAWQRCQAASRKPRPSPFASSSG